MSAATAALLAEARAAGARPRLIGEGRVRAPASSTPPELLVRLRERKAELAALLAGQACRRCGGPIVDRGPVAWIPFADGTAAHLACEDARDVERLRAQARNAPSLDALVDGGEVAVRGLEP